MTTKVNPNLVRQNFRKNAIINGNFDVWQRGTSFAAPADGSYTADRWVWFNNGTGVVTISQSTDVPTYAESGMTSQSSLLIDCTTADATLDTGVYIIPTYTVEGYDYAQLIGGNATLSFWVKATKTGTYCVAFRNTGLDRSYVVEYTVDSSDTWEKKVMTVPLTETGGTWNYTNGVGLRIGFALGAGSTYNNATANTWNSLEDYATSNQVNALDSTSNNFRLAQVQFEKGDAATELEYRHRGEELQLCRRYYEYWNFNNTTFTGGTMLYYQNTSTVTVVGFECAVPKRSRTDVSIAVTNLQYRIINTRSSISSLSTSLAHDFKSLVINGTAAAAGSQGQAYPIESTATTTIEVDAEL